jgi:ribonuclease VapC
MSSLRTGAKRLEKRLQLNSIVLDSSAALALILEEPGKERVDALLNALGAGGDVSVAMSAANWCEVLTRLTRDYHAMTSEELAAVFAGVELVPLGRAEAELAAGYARIDPSLSLGDRACLALASARNATAWTTDKIWARMNFGVALEMLR